MAWEIPTPTDIADQASTDLEEGMRAILTARGIDRPIDARSEYSVFRVVAGVIGLALYPVYLYFSWVVDQLFPDRCSEVWLAVHARIWRIERSGARAAEGSVIFAGSFGTAIPSSTTMTLSGSRWRTTEAATIGPSGTITVAAVAVTTGSSGNRDAGAELALESPIVGLGSQVATVDAGGLVGGEDQETIDDWRGRVIARIRTPPHGGAATDYETWAKDWGAARVTVYRSWIGSGTVGVVFAMADAAGALRAPTEVEIADLAATIEAVAPVTATVIVLGAVMRPVDVTVAISPWTSATVAAVGTAAAAFFRSTAIEIGSPLHVSQLRERISRAAGEDWHSLSAPVGETVAVGATELPQLGTLTVEAAS